MRRIFSTEATAPKERFSDWWEVVAERIAPCVHTPLADRPFNASISGTSIGGVTFTKMAFDPLRVEQTPKTIRHPYSRTDLLITEFLLSGTVDTYRDSGSSSQHAGEITIRDPNRPVALNHSGPVTELAVAIPRERLESVLGSARNFADLAMNRHSPTATLTRSFMSDLLRVGDQLSPETAARMTSIGIDLLVSSIAERMALEPLKPLHGTLTVQRAKAYIQDHFGDVDLDPAQVAAATGVSLRHLQALFHERGRNVAEWIWQRRLETAAQRLADPGLMHLPLGTLSYGCGFVNQAHFSRRFRDLYGLSPGDYRRKAMMNAAEASQDGSPES